MGYNAFGEPTGTEMTIPSSEGGLAGTYITEDKAYAKTGELESYEDSGNGGLPQETVNYTYDAAGRVTSVNGTQSYVNSLSYDELGNPQQYGMGTSAKPVYVTDSYDQQTDNLTEQQTSTGTTPTTVDDLKYSYDNIGDVLSENDQPAGGPAQSQCFSYDYLGRLTQAWSQGSACTASSAPSTSAESGAAAPYWENYTYDTVGNLTKQTSEAPDGTTTTTTGTFPAAGKSQPHAPTQETQVGTTTATTSYQYDADGDLTKTSGVNVTGTSVGGQSLSWDDAGRLASDQTSSGTTSYVYDADGNLLIEKDPGQSTLFLSDEQIVDNTTTGTLSGTRYYATSSEDGASAVASRSSSGEVDYLIGDQQGTASLAIRASDLNPTRRYYDPYGNQLATSSATWPAGNKGFVGGTESQATGLTDLGAREYQPQSGAFISPDPLLSPSDPQDLNGYAYAADNPSTDADPTGADDPKLGMTFGPPNKTEINNWNTAVRWFNESGNFIGNLLGTNDVANGCFTASWGMCGQGILTVASLFVGIREEELGTDLLNSLYDDSAPTLRNLARKIFSKHDDGGTPSDSKGPSSSDGSGSPSTDDPHGGKASPKEGTSSGGKGGSGGNTASGGGGTGVAITRSALKDALKPKQLFIGAVAGAAGNGLDAWESGDHKGEIINSIILGGVTGALSNVDVGAGMGLGKGGALGASMLAGGVAGSINGVGSQLISNHDNLSKVNMGWVALDSGIGAWGNAVGTEIQGDNSDATFGNLMSGFAGLWPSALCGGLGKSQGWNC